MNTETYTLEGVAFETATQQELFAMLQRQIEMSFKLKFHREQRMIQASDERGPNPIVKVINGRTFRFFLTPSEKKDARAKLEMRLANVMVIDSAERIP